jgi:hypothetical protein
MHAHSGGVYTSLSRGDRGILLSKYSKSGNKLVCAASLAELRSVADQIHAYAIFGGRVVSEIRNFMVCRENGDEDAFWRVLLRDKPPLPTPLNWQSPKDLLIEPYPPESFRE